MCFFHQAIRQGANKEKLDSMREQLAKAIKEHDTKEYDTIVDAVVNHMKEVDVYDTFMSKGMDEEITQERVKRRTTNSRLDTVVENDEGNKNVRGLACRHISCSCRRTSEVHEKMGHVDRMLVNYNFDEPTGKERIKTRNTGGDLQHSQPPFPGASIDLDADMPPSAVAHWLRGRKAGLDRATKRDAAMLQGTGLKERGGEGAR